MPRSFARRSFVSRWADAGDPGWAGARYDPARARHGHVESWFLAAADPARPRAIWLKWTVWAGDRAPARAIAESWAVAFGPSGAHVATKTAVPFDGARVGRAGLDLAVDGCTLTPSAARGRVESGGRAIAYDLTIAAVGPPALALEPVLRPWMYAAPWPAQKLASPIPDARVSGTAAVGGETWTLDRWPGMVGHTWGRAHSTAYAWAHCNAWDGGEGVVVEGATATVRLGRVPFPAATVLRVRDGEAGHALNGPVAWARNAGEITPRRWRFAGRSARVEIAGELWADTDDFVGLFYPNPDGSMCHCLHTGLARAEVTLRVGGGPPRTLRSSRASLEIGTRDPHHGVRMHLG